MRSSPAGNSLVASKRPTNLLPHGMVTRESSCGRSQVLIMLAFDACDRCRAVTAHLRSSLGPRNSCMQCSKPASSLAALAAVSGNSDAIGACQDAQRACMVVQRCSQRQARGLT